LPPEPAGSKRGPDPKAHMRLDRVSTPRGFADAAKALGLRENFSASELRAAYVQAAMQWHPDRPMWVQGGERLRLRATAAFRRAKVAHDLLLPLAEEEDG